METINRWMFLIGLVLVMATCLTGNRFSKRLDDAFYLSTTIRNEACHADHCHNSTTYIHGCATVADGDCHNLTMYFNVHNVTGWRNTTCHLHACYSDDTQADRKIRKRAKTRGPSRPCLDGSFWPRLPFQHAHQNARFKREFLQRNKYGIESHSSNFVWCLRTVNSHENSLVLRTRVCLTTGYHIRRDSWISPIRLSPIGHSPMAKIHELTGESTEDFRQLTNVHSSYCRKYTGSSPIGEVAQSVLAKVQGTFANWRKSTTLSSNNEAFKSCHRYCPLRKTTKGFAVKRHWVSWLCLLLVEDLSSENFITCHEFRFSSHLHFRRLAKVGLVAGENKVESRLLANVY